MPKWLKVPQIAIAPYWHFLKRPPDRILPRRSHILPSISQIGMWSLYLQDSGVEVCEVTECCSCTLSKGHVVYYYWWPQWINDVHWLMVKQRWHHTTQSAATVVWWVTLEAFCLYHCLHFLSVVNLSVGGRRRGCMQAACPVSDRCTHRYFSSCCCPGDVSGNGRHDDQRPLM